MKTSQREILSERFITLFNRLSEESSLSNEHVSSVLEISIKTLHQYLDRTHLITIVDAYTFCIHFQLGFEYMFKDITNWQEEVASKLNCGFQSNLSVIGGYGISDFQSFTPSINKNIKAEKRIFKVEGDSMTGGRNNIEEGDVLVTQLLRSLSDFKEFIPYVFQHDCDGLYVKELQSLKVNGKIVGFNCISDLNIYYKPFDILGNPNTKVYKITQVIKESVRIKLRKAVGKSKLRDVFESLVNTFHDNNDLILLESRFFDLHKLINNGIIENGLDKEMNRIKNSLLTIIDEIAADDLCNINFFK